MKNPDNDPDKKVKEALKAQGFVGEGIPGDGETSVRVPKKSNSVIRRVNDRVQQLLEESDATCEQARESALDEVVEEVEAGAKSFPDMGSYLQYMLEQGGERVDLDCFKDANKKTIIDTFDIRGAYILIPRSSDDGVVWMIVYLSKDDSFKVLHCDSAVKTGGGSTDNEKLTGLVKGLKERGFRELREFNGKNISTVCSLSGFFQAYLTKKIAEQKAQAEIERAASFPY